jgi:hypothetical protein
MFAFLKSESTEHHRVPAFKDDILRVSIGNSIMFNKSKYRLLKSAYIDIALSVNLFIVSLNLNFSLGCLISAVCALALSCENGRLRSTVYTHQLSCVESLALGNNAANAGINFNCKN